MAIDYVNPGTIRPFRYWCQKVLPAVYDDSLSYYELLCKVAAHLNDVVELTNTQSDAITELQTLVENFLEMEVDPYIEELVDQWFQDNQPQIVNRIDALEDDTDDLSDVVAHIRNESYLHKNVITIGDSFGRGTGAGESGAPNNQGWPYYISSYLQPSFFLNISNSAAGFVKAGHTDPYSGMSFTQMVNYAYDNQLGNTSPDDIDLIIIGGGVNDSAQTNRINIAYQTIRNIQSKFPNAQIWYFPLASGDMVMDTAHYDCFNELCYGCSEGGAQVFTQSLYWLYPFQDRASYGDQLHPNQQGYHFIGSFMSASLCGSYMPNQLWDGSTHPSTDGLVIADGATNISFSARAINGNAYFGGNISRVGQGFLCTLPSYCKPNTSTQLLAYAYADSTHQGIARIVILADGRMQFIRFVNQGDEYDPTLTYTIYFPPTLIPLGHMWC